MLKMMSDEDFIVSKTDLKGKITYCNKIFMDMAEYSEAELLGKPHNLIRHPDMPKAVFKLLWNNIENKEEVFAYVINKTKNNNDYWVFANITTSLDERGNKIGYYSVRRKPNPKALEVIIPLYKKMKEAERDGGVEASTKVLLDVLNEKGMVYNELMISLQD